MAFRTAGNGIMYGRSSIPGAMLWMFGMSLILGLLLWWVPLVGPFIGPIVGGYVGGRRAGTPGRALKAAILPAILLSLLIFVLGLVGNSFFGGTPAGIPISGGAAIMVFVIGVVHNLVLLAAALVGGAVRQSEPDGY
jgi:hypothetical protein